MMKIHNKEMTLRIWIWIILRKIYKIIDDDEDKMMIILMKGRVQCAGVRQPTRDSITV